MADFTVRADHIDVEQIMRQIRARIRDKRGADYTEEEIRELAAVKLEKFLDPRAVRSDLLKHYQQQHQPAPLIMPEEAHPPLYDFTPQTVYVSDRGVAGRILTIVRKILKPFTKLFFHVDTVWDVLSKQSVLNAQHTRLFQRAHQRFITRDELDSLNFEMFNNLVVELTRLGIEVKNLRMQVESFGTRLDFDERRARALEGVVQYRPGATVAKAPSPSAAGGDEDEEEPIGTGPGGEADSLSRSARRRRRRRGRRHGAGDESEAAPMSTPTNAASTATVTPAPRPIAPVPAAESEPVTTPPPPANEPEPAAVQPFFPESAAPEPAAPEPAAPGPAASGAIPSEPQRVFHRVFDRPREPEPASDRSEQPSLTPTREDAPGSDDHEPSQS